MRKITFWLTLVLIFTVPWEDGFSIHAVGSLTKLLGLVVAGFWALTMLTEGRFRKPNAFHAVVLVFFLWNAASYMWSMDVSRTIGRITTYGQIFIFMLIIWEMLQKPSDLTAGLQAYVLGAFVLIASTLINYFQGTVATNNEVRFSATGVNAVDIVLFLLMGLPIAWHLITRPDKNKNRTLKILNMTYLPLSIFTALLTGSRTSLFAVIPAAIYIFWPKRFNIVKLILLFMLVTVSIVIFQAILPSGVTERLASASSSISSADLDGRVTLWRAAISIFTTHPISGGGSGSLNTTIGALAHNTFVSVLAETGLIGFALFVCILAVVLNQAVKLPKGYAGLWLSSFLVWFIGVLSLSFEFRKVTWLFFSFIIIEGSALYQQFHSQDVNLELSEVEESQSLGVGLESNG
jgi:O-antigen ligase